LKRPLEDTTGGGFQHEKLSTAKGNRTVLGRRFSYVRVATVLSALIAIVGSWWLIERMLL
jgi:hypothetical protein